MKKIKAIVFDWDKMVYHEPIRFSEYYSKRYKVPMNKQLEFFDGEFKDCLVGKLDMKEILSKKYLPKWGWTKGINEFLAMWFEYGKIDREIMEIIKRLKKQKIICILATRNEKYRTDYIKKKYQLESLFDYIFSSCDIGFKKPDLRFYKEILKNTKLKPEEIVIFDDRTEHIENPRNMGFISLLYKNKSQFKKDLAKIGIKCFYH